MGVGLKSTIKKSLLGIDINQEYLCLAKESLSNPLSLQINISGRKLNVSDFHVFIGYKPLLIGIPFPAGDENIAVMISFKKIKLNFLFSEKTVAALDLKFICEKKFEKTRLMLFEGARGSNEFLSDFHYFTNLLLNKMRPNKAGNINLPGNLYEQVKIAYSVPRIICLVSLGKNEMYNVFPTDLHGRIDANNYVISLRTGGLANKQVNEIKKITLSKMDLKFYREVFSLGKNHMQEQKPLKDFTTSGLYSVLYKNPVPKGAVSYMELEHFDCFTCGIHNLNFFRIKHEQIIENNNSTLSQIHRDYVLWRNRKGLETKYFLR